MVQKLMKQNGYTFYKQKHQSCIVGGVGKLIEEKEGLSLFLSLFKNPFILLFLIASNDQNNKVTAPWWQCHCYPNQHP
jgi:hypothetical protein